MVARHAPGLVSQYPQVIVMFGATGDLARRKLLPGLFHLSRAGFLPACRIIGVSLDELDADGFRTLARGVLDEFSPRGLTLAEWDEFSGSLDYVPMSAGAGGVKAAVERAERALGVESRRLHRSMRPIQPSDVVRGQYTGYRSEEGIRPDSETETFIALKCSIENWRWAGVPFYLRTGKRMAEGQRIISIAFRQPPQSMFPPDSGVGAQGPDHLTFDLADCSKLSLSFYGKRPGPGMQLDKLSLQFALHDTGLAGEVLEAYERLILDAIRGDHTLFTTAEGIERLWELSAALLEAPPPVRSYAPGSWGPNAIHQLIAPHAWRLPFERAWRDPNA